MSVKSWVVALSEKASEKSAKKTLQNLKASGTRMVWLGEDASLYFVNDEGTVIPGRKGLVFDRTDSNLVNYNNKQYDQLVQAWDKLLGPHRQSVEDGKPVLVWDVQ